MFQQQEYRITVAGLVLRPVVRKSSPFPPVLLQWPRKAAQQQAGNLTTVQGGMEPHDPDPLTAMRREIREEYGIRRSTIYPLNHRRYCSPDTRKEYVWFLILCDDRVSVVPDHSEVEQVAWYYCPQTLLLGIKQMNRFKAVMYREVFEAAADQHPEAFGDYVSFIARHRKLRRLREERLAYERQLAS